VLNDTGGGNPSLEMIDSTIIRAHHCAAGAKGGLRQGLGRSKGGFTTKIHLGINALGLPVGFVLTGGEVSDYTGYAPLMAHDGPEAKVRQADKGYDADFIRQDMGDRGRIAVIPTRENRKEQIPVDPAIYALRNIIERCFNKLKNARRLATRYDKTAASFAAFVSICSIRLWFRHFGYARMYCNKSV
jgi:transposase